MTDTGKENHVKHARLTTATNVSAKTAEHGPGRSARPIGLRCRHEGTRPDRRSHSARNEFFASDHWLPLSRPRLEGPSCTRITSHRASASCISRDGPTRRGRCTAVNTGPSGDAAAGDSPAVPLSVTTAERCSGSFLDRCRVTYPLFLDFNRMPRVHARWTINIVFIDTNEIINIFYLTRHDP